MIDKILQQFDDKFKVHKTRRYFHIKSFLKQSLLEVKEETIKECVKELFINKDGLRFEYELYFRPNQIRKIREELLKKIINKKGEK